MSRNILASVAISPDKKLYVQISNSTNNLGKIYEITSRYRTVFNDDGSPRFRGLSLTPVEFYYKDLPVSFPNQQLPDQLTKIMPNTTQVNLIHITYPTLVSNLIISFSADSPGTDTGIFQILINRLDYSLEEFTQDSIIRRKESPLLRIAKVPSELKYDDTGNEPDSMLQLFLDSEKNLQVQKVNFIGYFGRDGVNVNGVTPIPSIDPTVPPKLLQLDGEAYPSMVVGRCQDNHLQTCLVILQDTTATATIKTPAAVGDMVYDPKYCIDMHLVNGEVVMVDTNQYWKYTIRTSEWENGVINGKNPNNILTCATDSRGIYAISQAEQGVVPDIFVIGKNNLTWIWTWQKPNMTVAASTYLDNVWVSPNNSKSPLLIASTVGVVVGCAIIIGAIYYFRRKRNRENRKLPGHGKSHIKKGKSKATETLDPDTDSNTGIPLEVLEVQAAQSLSLSNSESLPDITAISTNSNSFPITNSSIPLSTFSTSLAAVPDTHFTIPSTSLPDNGEGSSTGGIPRFNIQRSSNYIYPALEEEVSETQPAEIQPAEIQPGNTSRQLDDALSPTLANAQLVLQQSQQPANN